MNPIVPLVAIVAYFFLSENSSAADPEHDTPAENDVGMGNLQAFLQMIRYSEGTAGSDGYRMLYGGSLFESFADHPRTVMSVGGRKSSAAGAYQILQGTWDTVVQPRAALPDFSPESQDAACVVLIKYRGAYDDVVAGRFADAVAKCRKEWASLPGAGYNQPERKLEALQEAYVNAGGNVA